MALEQLTAADFTSLRLQYKNQPNPGDLPACIEHLFADGVMVDHYFVTPAPAVLADPDIAALGEVNGVLFIQQENAPWQVYFQEPTMTQEVCVEMPDSEFRAMLVNLGVTLPGE